jgi:hypothetical protein
VLPIKFLFIWPSGFRGEDFFLEINPSEELLVAAMFVNDPLTNMADMANFCFSLVN